MLCPYCNSEMKTGRITTKAVLNILNYPADVIFEPDDYFDSKKVSSPLAEKEGYYCPNCNKIIGIFNVSR